ncbi:MAG: protein kinase, partial [archaeon]|nr:protein kinase [archaeon]
MASNYNDLNPENQIYNQNIRDNTEGVNFQSDQKRHKSQDEYSPRLIKSDKKILNTQFNQKNISPNNKKILQQSPKLIHSNKGKGQMQIQSEDYEFENQNENSNKKKKKHIKEGSLEKIMSDTDSCQEISSDSDDDSRIIDEEDMDEGTYINELPSRKNIDKGYLGKTNTSPNRINTKEAGKVKTMINAFPKLSSNPFITNPNEDKEKGKDIEMVNTSTGGKKSDKSVKKVSPRHHSKDITGLYRDLLVLARKGDKDTFIETLGKILKKEGDVNYKDERGFTALHYACDEGNLKIVDILIKARCELNVKTFEKKTPLHLTAIHGYFDISKLLIENGASLNASDNEKNTPIHFCASNGHIELMKFFLEKLPNVEVRNIYGKSPLDEAKSEELKNILSEYIYKKGSKDAPLKLNDLSDEGTYDSAAKKNNISNEAISNGRRAPNVLMSNVGNFEGIEKSKIGLGLSPINANKNISQIALCSSHNTVLKNDVLSQNRMSSAAKNTSKNKNLGVNKTLRKCNTKNFSSNPTLSSKKNSYTLQSIIKKTTYKIGNNSTATNSSLNNSSNRGSKNFSKKNSVTSFQNKSTSINGRKFQGYSLGTNPQSFHKTKTLQKFLTHSNSNLKGEAINGAAPTNVKENLTSTVKANLSLEQNERLNKTEDNPHHKNFATNPNDSKANEENLYNQINLNSIEEEERVDITCFSCLGILGRGSFGDVFLVQKNDNKQQYAMKVLNKERIMSQNLLKYVMTERNVLSLTSHPFIVKMFYSFQTWHKLFLILEYCPKGDLSKHLKYEKKFPEDRARFYLCEILLALEDLHRRGIIFRDLKPDNVVLDNDGHAKLTDFGLSKEGVFESNGAKSFCGS